MKKLICLTMFVFLFTLTSASAVELDMDSEYAQEETVIGKVSGNFVKPPTEDNLFLYRNHVRVPIDSEVFKINDEYYFYFILGHSPGNYTFKIKNTEYHTGVDTSEEDITKNITITNKTADFRINQGVFDVNNTFRLSFKSLSPSGIDIDFSETNNSAETGKIEPYSEDFPLKLKSGEENKIYFILKNFDKPTLKELKFSSENTEYNVPVFVSESLSDSNNTSENISENESFSKMIFSPEEINLSLETNSENKSFFIHLNNTGTEKIEEINFSVSDRLEESFKFYETTLDELSTDSVAKIKFKIIPSDIEKTLSGYILAESSEGLYTRSKINLDFYSNESTEDNQSQNQHQLNENNTDINISDPDNGESSTQQLIGWSLLALIVVFVAWFYFKKYKGAQSTPKNPLLRKKP